MTQREVREKKSKWELYRKDLPLDDKWVNISWHGKGEYQLAGVSLTYKECTKRELFKRLMWRIWKNR